jgi:MED6 mediator sub complex component
MAADVQNMTPDMTGSMWRDDAWLRAYPLNVHTALDYFSLSPFYEHNCSNEKAKRQGLHLTQLQCVAVHRLSQATCM